MFCIHFNFVVYILNNIKIFLQRIDCIGALGYGDAFHIKTPILSGTPLNAWVMAPIYIIVYGSIVLIVELLRRKKKQSLKEKQGND